MNPRTYLCVSIHKLPRVDSDHQWSTVALINAVHNSSCGAENRGMVFKLQTLRTHKKKKTELPMITES